MRDPRSDTTRITAVICGQKPPPHQTVCKPRHVHRQQPKAWSRLRPSHQLASDIHSIKPRFVSRAVEPWPSSTFPPDWTAAPLQYSPLLSDRQDVSFRADEPFDSIACACCRPTFCSLDSAGRSGLRRGSRRFFRSFRSRDWAFYNVPSAVSLRISVEI